jgi:hypothetical protein
MGSLGLFGSVLLLLLEDGREFRAYLNGLSRRDRPRRRHARWSSGIVQAQRETPKGGSRETMS